VVRFFAGVRVTLRHHTTAFADTGARLGDNASMIVEGCPAPKKRPCQPGAICPRKLCVFFETGPDASLYYGTPGTDMQIISRAEAKAKGLKRYFTGKPCKHGHVAERQVFNATCVECERTALKRYREKLAARRR
jgi:hypothetical protein